MPGELYHHIFLPGPTRTQNFTNPRRGGSSPRIPDRDRQGHSDHLRERLDRAWQEAGEKQAVAHVDRQGVYVEFAGEPGFDLAVQSLEAIAAGIRLQNVRKEGEGDAQRTLATVYIPHTKRSYLLKKIQKYATELTKANKPKNKKLINSISEIRLAVLESFWRPDDQALIPADAPEWIEVWLGSDRDEVVARFEALSESLGLELRDGVLRFPERSVKLIRGNRAQLEELVERSDHIAEFRPAREVATFYVELENKDQLDLVQEFLARCRFDNDIDVAVCLLDTGVNNGHPLLRPVLADEDLHTVREEWQIDDHHGHGTLIAGTATYGDLLVPLSSQNAIRVSHCLESVKILPPPPAENPKHLWGHLTLQGISRAEIQAPERKRIVCLTATAKDDRDRGRPSSWSAALDEAASGYDDDIRRLIVVSAGNVDDPGRNYPNDNLTNEVHDPGQAWNALTVGAWTEKTNIVDPTLTGYVPIAPAGGLSPYSTTSATWPPRKWPIKPEVVFEGGNVARGPNDSVFDSDDLKLLSTNKDLQVAHFAPFWATSAASAEAARMAAQIQVEYPDIWPETVRALIVHSADWTGVMKHQFLRNESKQEYARLLRVCGYGVPNLGRALYCASNSLTLISEASLQPFDKGEARYVTRDMHLYRLPWPADVLTGLGEIPVTMRVTLSYFVEPSPGEIGWENRYRYSSHALRFDINGPGESQDEFVSRVNVQARDDGTHPGTTGSGENWTIGEARNVGSIHSDIWRGRAADLASSNMIAIYPAVGWWRERTNQGRWDKSCRYALIVSIQTPGEEIDIYTPVAILIGIQTPIVIEVPQL